MASSNVDIANSCLKKLGSEKRISSFTEGGKEANAILEQYAKVRDALLRTHYWNFAKKRVKLARTTDTPVSGYTYEYQLPVDWIRTYAAHANDAATGQLDYKPEGDKLLSSVESVYLTYIYQVTDTNLMTTDFREVLAWALAKDIAVGIAQSNTIKEVMTKEYKSALRQAKSTDAMDDTPDKFPEGSWVTDRY